MRQRFSTAIVGAALFAALAAPTASASAPTAEILVNANFDTGVETFTATGFCSSGSALTSNLRIVGGRGGVTFHLDKTLTCDDGSGSLTISVNAATSQGHPAIDAGGWSVVSGTGAWAAASGGGSIVGTYVPTGVIDDYTGNIRR